MVFVCPFCNAKYRLLTNLKRHVREQHRVEKCPFCPSDKEKDLCLHSIQFIRFHADEDERAYNLHVALWYLSRSCSAKYLDNDKFLRLRRLGRDIIFKMFNDGS